MLGFTKMRLVLTKGAMKHRANGEHIVCYVANSAITALQMLISA